MDEGSVFLRIGGQKEEDPNRLPCIPYQALWDRLPAGKFRRFDAVCNLIERLTHEEMIALLDPGA